MSEDGFKHVTIIGVGLLGGSIGLALRARGVRVAGVGRRQASLREALKVGAIDTAHLDAAEIVGQSDLVILATPVCAFEGYLRAIAPHLKAGAIVTDVGSTKAIVMRQARKTLGTRGRFVGSHPMAGSERKGPAFAKPHLLVGATCIVTAAPGQDGRIVARIERFWRMLGMRTLRMPAAAHDRALAAVSHLPHLAAGMLMMLPRTADLAVAATGLRDTTRLASGDPEMWRDILLTNRGEVVAAIRRLGKLLDAAAATIQSGDARQIERMLARAKARRDATIGKTGNGGQ